MSKFFDENVFSFVDIETNGMSSDDGRIIEIAIVQMRSHKIINEYTTLIDHQEDYLPWFIENLTGISVDMLKGKPTFREISNEIYGMLNNTIFVAHNVSFDYNFIQEKLAREMLEIDLFRLCTLKLFRKLSKELKSHRLDSMITMLGIEVSSRHRAMDDTKVMTEYYMYLLDTFGEDGLQDIISKHIQEKKVKKIKREVILES